MLKKKPRINRGFFSLAQTVKVLPALYQSGFLSSAAASAVGSGVDHLGINSVALYIAAEIASGGLSGGLGSVIAGGDFWRGAEQGVIATAYNHAVHGLYNKITENSMPDDIRFRDSKGRLIATYATDKADADIYLPFKDPLASNINLNKILGNIDLEDLDAIGIGGNWDFTFAMGGGVSLEAVYFLDGNNKGQYQIYRTKRQNFGFNGGVGVYAIFADYKGGDKTLNFNNYTGVSFSVSAGIKGPWIGSYSKFWGPLPRYKETFGWKSFLNSKYRLWSGYTVGFGIGAGVQWSRQKTKIYKR